MPTIRHTLRNAEPHRRKRVSITENSSVGGEHASQHILIGLMIFNLILGILTACMVLHLGIQSSKKTTDSQALLLEIERMKRTFADSQQVGGRLDNPPDAEAGSASEEEMASPENSSCYLIASEALRIAGEARNYTYALKPSLDSRVAFRHYKNRVNAVLEAVRALESSQEFLRKQIHQRLGAVESTSVSLERNIALAVGFQVSLSKNLVTTPRGGIVGFDVIGFNEGGGFVGGVFRVPQPGLYVITLNVIMRLRSHSDYSGWEKPIKVALRLNKIPTNYSFQQPFVQDTEKVTHQLVAVLKLRLAAVIDIYASGFSKFSLGRGSSLCGALIRSTP